MLFNTDIWLPSNQNVQRKGSEFFHILRQYLQVLNMEQAKLKRAFHSLKVIECVSKLTILKISFNDS